jgi:hypothetical protein
MKMNRLLWLALAVAGFALAVLVALTGALS